MQRDFMVSFVAFMSGSSTLQCGLHLWRVMPWQQLLSNLSAAPLGNLSRILRALNLRKIPAGNSLNFPYEGLIEGSFKKQQMLLLKCTF